MSQHHLDATNGEIILFLNYERNEQKRSAGQWGKEVE